MQKLITGAQVDVSLSDLNNVNTEDAVAGNFLQFNGTDWVSAEPAGTGTVTSVSVDVPDFLSVSGSPITESGVIDITLSGTPLPISSGGTGQTTAQSAIDGLVPNQTDNAGKVLTTDGTNVSWETPSGSISAPDMQLVFGTGAGITSDSTLLYDLNTSTLVIGGVDPAVIKSNNGAELIINGESSLALRSDSGVIDIQSEIVTSGNAGNAGDVLTCDGPGFAPYWAAAGSSEVFIASLSENDGSPVTFNGAPATNWTAITDVSASFCSWDFYNRNILFSTQGTYRISITAIATPVTQWPTNLTSYGTTVSTSYSLTNTRWSSYSEVYPNNFQGLTDFTSAPDQNITQWTDTYVFIAQPGDAQSVGVYAANYGQLFDEVFLNATVVVERLADAIFQS